MSSYVETMAYVGQIPWHGTGTYLGDQNVNGERMMREAGLGWNVGTVPLFDGAGREVEGYWGTQRDSDARVLGVVQGRYTPVQNRALFDFGDDLRTVSGEGVKWHTAGSLKGGRTVWALAQAAGSLTVRSGDTLAPFLLLSSSHDGTSPLRAMFTSVRVVCWNTLTAAGRKGAVSIRHTVSAADRIEEAKHTLGLMRETFTAEGEDAIKLVGKRMARPDFVELASQILTGEDDVGVALEKVKRSEGRERSLYASRGGELVALFQGGIGNRGETLWDGLNAVTEWVDYQRSRSDTYKSKSAALGLGFDSAMFGHGAAVKQRAKRLLLKRVS